MSGFKTQPQESGCGVDRVAEFKHELCVLLKKYSASIGVGYADCSDTHGMSGEHMVIEFDNDYRKSVTICHGWGISAYDLEDD